MPHDLTKRPVCLDFLVVYLLVAEEAGEIPHAPVSLQKSLLLKNFITDTTTETCFSSSGSVLLPKFSYEKLKHLVRVVVFGTGVGLECFVGIKFLATT